MKKYETIIITILLILVILGGLYGCKKYLTLKDKDEDKLNKNKVTEKVYANEVDINEEIEGPITNVEDEIIGRLEISELNIKIDLLSSQLKYTTSGLNKKGNSVIYLENIEYQNIVEDTEIYIRNAEGEKAIYKVFNLYESIISDTSFYEDNTEEIQMTLVININDTSILVIQAYKQ